MPCCRVFWIRLSEESCAPSRPSPKYDNEILYADSKYSSSDLGEGECDIGMDIFIHAQ